jgi:hypothetical protein
VEQNVTPGRAAEQYQVLARIELPAAHLELRLSRRLSDRSVDLRVFRRHRDGTRWRPSPAGLWVPLSRVDELVAALQGAADDAGPGSP